MPEIDRILEGVEKIKNYGKDASELTGVLRMAIPDSILIYRMQPFIMAFMHEAPKVQLIVNSIPSEDINQALVEGTVDLGINCEKDRYPDTVEHKNLGNYQVMLIASATADQQHLDFINPHQKKEFSLICNEPKGYYQMKFDEYLKKKDIIMNPYMKVQSIEAVKQCVQSNLGVAVVPGYSVEKEIKEGTLIQVRTELDERVYNGICLYNKNKWISPQMKLALELLEKYHA